MADEHVTSPAAAFVVFLVLMALLVVTVLAAAIEDPVWGLVTAITIAVVKAALIIYYFMNVRFSDAVTRLFVVSAFLWLGLLLGLMMGDYLTRDQAPRGQAAGIAGGIDSGPAKVSHAE